MVVHLPGTLVRKGLTSAKLPGPLRDRIHDSQALGGTGHSWDCTAGSPGMNGSHSTATLGSAFTGVQGGVSEALGATVIGYLEA